MVSPPWHNYRYHQNRPPSQENPKFNFWEIFGLTVTLILGWILGAGTSVSDFNRPTYKSACDIHLKHVFLTEYGS